MKKRILTPNMSEKLILAGIEELNQYGLQAFSVRRIARRCGISCSAPYKHFSNKHGFISAIIEYINMRWLSRLESVKLHCGPGPRAQLVAISLEYIRFLVENSSFRSIIMMNYGAAGMRDSQYPVSSRLSSQILDIISEYCREVDMSDEDRFRKTFAVRSFIYGAAFLFDNGELEYTTENMNMVEKCIEREFDIV
jgi:AcrR family transcriptional regulator